MKRSEECLSGTRVICAATLDHLLAHLMDEPGGKQTEGRLLLELGVLPQFITKPTLIMLNILTRLALVCILRTLWQISVKSNSLRTVFKQQCRAALPVKPVKATKASAATFYEGKINCPVVFNKPINM